MMRRREKLSARLSAADVHVPWIPDQISNLDNDYDVTDEGNHRGRSGHKDETESGHEDETESHSSHEREQRNQYINENRGISPLRYPQAFTSLESRRAINLLTEDLTDPYLPTLSSSSKQKQPLPIHSTISDDRSQGSEFDRSGRIFLALKQTATNNKSPSDRILEGDFEQQSHALTPPNTRRQLQQSRELLESIDSDEELERRARTRLRRKRQQKYEQYQQQPQLQLEERRRQSQSSLEQIDPLADALDLVAKALNIQKNPKLTIETLHEYLLDLNSKKEAQKPAVPIVQLVHRVINLAKGQISERLYLDQPLWLDGATSSREAFAGNLPLRNISSYLSKHSNICCIIYRDYDITSLIGKIPLDEDLDARTDPEQAGEFIEPVTSSLTTAVARFLDYYKFHEEGVADSVSANLIAPYVAIYHARKDDITSFMETLERSQQTQFHAMLDYILSRYEDDYSLIDEMTSNGKITQAYIEYLFKPGDIIVHGKDQEARGYLCKSWLWKDMIKSTAIHQQGPNKDKLVSTFKLRTWSWDFDGKFSKKESVMHVEFGTKDYSEKDISDLSIRPLRYVDGATETRLKSRGKWLWKCRERRMVSYDGTPQELRHSSDERYMVDMIMYRELHIQDSTSAKRIGADYLEIDAMKQEQPPDENFAYLAPLTIKAYNLKRKKWMDLKLDGLRDVSWNKRAFESLVLNKKTKRLIQALISNQIEAEKSTDLISGKGNGLIMLLHGGPGTGKTLTAESVAEIANKPLYPVTCGDIGTKPEDVEKYLESVLYLGKTWGCVVLLDEADVFLEQRSLEDLHRNALVSVFLRVLEYYDGILILTSNRVGTFDEAFRSRIQLAVHYSSLTIHQRTKVWENFIGRLKELNEEGIDFDDLEDNIEQLASREMNGREIRNAITTARQYARWERQQDQGFKLNYNVMKEVIKTAGEFDEYINTLNGGLTQEQLAKEDGIR